MCLESGLISFGRSARLGDIRHLAMCRYQQQALQGGSRAVANDLGSGGVDTLETSRGEATRRSRDFSQLHSSALSGEYSQNGQARQEDSWLGTSAAPQASLPLIANSQSPPQCNSAQLNFQATPLLLFLYLFPSFHCRFVAYLAGMITF